MKIGSCTISPIRKLDELLDNKAIICKWLRKALEKVPENDLTCILQSVYEGNTMLWLTRREEEIIGVTTTQVLDHPNERHLLIELLGGKDIKEWVHLIADIEAWGKDLGCVKSEIHGRPAWKKLLPEYKSNIIIYNRVL